MLKLPGFRLAGFDNSMMTIPNISPLFRFTYEALYVIAISASLELLVNPTETILPTVVTTLKYSDSHPT